MVGDFTNPILTPEAAAVVKGRGEEAVRGIDAPTPLNQCFPDGIPFDFAAPKVQLLQRPDKITFIIFDVQFREVRLNQPHPARVTPSWFGDSVGHYEGDTLVIDTIGIKAGPLAMVDMFGTPHTGALHVVERYRLIDEPAAQEAQRRNAKENFLIPPGNISADLDPNYRGKHLQLEFTVEDPGMFTMPWSATVTYGRPLDSGFYEYICAENPHEYYAGRDTAVPTATKPDF